MERGGFFSQHKITRNVWWKVKRLHGSRHRFRGEILSKGVDFQDDRSVDQHSFGRSVERKKSYTQFFDGMSFFFSFVSTIVSTRLSILSALIFEIGSWGKIVSGYVKMLSNECSDMYLRLICIIRCRETTVERNIQREAKEDAKVSSFHFWDSH